MTDNVYEESGGYRVEVQGGQVTVSRGGKGQTFELNQVIDPVPRPFIPGLRKLGLDPRDFVYVSGANTPVRRGAKPMLERAYEEWKIKWQEESEREEARKYENFPGLRELEDAREDEERHTWEFDRMMDDENNDGARPPKPVKVPYQDLADRYPRAALYLRAESYSLAAHSQKVFAGQRAMKVLEENGSMDDAQAEMDKWDKSTSEE